MSAQATDADTTRTLLDEMEKGGLQMWDRLPTESERDYALFRMYKDMGPMRSLRSLCEALGYKSVNIPGSITERSRRFLWRLRTKSWDIHCDHLAEEKRDEAMAKEAALWATRLQRFREDEFRAGRLMLDRILLVLEDPDTFPKAKFGPIVLTKWLEAASRFARLAMEQPTNRTQVETNTVIDMPDLEEASDSELWAFVEKAERELEDD